MAKTNVISVANQKGGVGKSTSVYCIGAGLALQGKKVLLLDVDPQGDLSKMLGQRKPHELPYTLGDVMNDVVSGKEITEHTEILHHHEGFDYVPGNRVLSAVEVGLVNVMSRETVLRQYLDSIKKEYDYVLLDCRPSLGMLVINALAASDYVLIPVQADYLAAEDMTELIGTVQQVKRQINPKLKNGGVFLTIQLIWKFLKAGYMEQWTYNRTYSGVPQGSGVSPVLANIYLHELDRFMEEYAENFSRGQKRLVNPEYNKSLKRAAYYRRMGKQKWEDLSPEQRKERIRFYHIRLFRIW